MVMRPFIALILGCGATLSVAQYWQETVIESPLTNAAGARFGTSLSMEDEYLLIGAPGSSEAAPESGAAFIYKRNEGGMNAWGMVRQLGMPDAAPLAQFGTKVLLSGNRAYVSAPGDRVQGIASGALYVFERDLGGVDNWGLLQRLNSSPLSEGMRFGSHFDQSAVGLIVSCPGWLGNVGAFVSFSMSGSGTFEQQRFIPYSQLYYWTVTAPTIRNECAIADTLLLIRRGDDQVAFSLPVGPLFEIGSTITGPTPIVLTNTFGLGGAQMYFGEMRWSGERLLSYVDVQGSPFWLPRLVEFKRDAFGALVQAGYLLPDTPNVPIPQGWGAFDVSGNRVAIGAGGEVFGSPPGHVEVFQADDLNASGWARIAMLVPTNQQLGELFGYVVEVENDVVAVGAPLYGTPSRGRVYVFRDPNIWVEEVPSRGRQTGLVVYPSQVGSGGGNVTVQMVGSVEQGDLSLLSSDGRLVRSLPFRTPAIVDVHGLSPGQYWFILNTHKGFVRAPLIIAP